MAEKDSAVKMEMNTKFELNNLLSRREAYFERLQHVYKLSQNMEDEVSIELFLSKVETLDIIRTSYLETVESINILESKLNPKYKPTHQTWLAFEDLFCLVKSQIKRLIVSREYKPCDTNIKSTKLKLPALEIPEFSGDPQVWPLFYTSFKTIIHENNSLTDAERIHYLISKLKGPAKLVLAGLTPIASNYNIIYTTLVNKYEDLRFQATTYLDNIFNLKPLTNTTADGLECFVDKLASSVAALRGLKIDNLAEFVFLYITLKRLDPEITRAFEMDARGTDIPTFDSLISFLREQVKILYRTPILKSHHNKNIQRSNEKFKQTLVSCNVTQSRSIDHSMNLNSHACSLCSLKHDHLYKCSAFRNLSPQDRYNFTKSNNYCFNCLSSQHRIKNCNSKSSCKVCSNRHNTMLHIERETPFAPQTCFSPPHTGRERAPHAPAVAPPPRPLASPQLTAPAGSSIAMTASDIPIPAGRNTVLLGTARVIVYDSHGRERLLRCLLDCGSQSNFITSNACEQLGLNNSQRAVNVVIKGIGGNKAVSTLLNIKIHSRFNKMISYTLDTLVVDRITDTLPNVTVDRSMLSNIDSLPLADDTYGTPGEIDLLIGASLFSHLWLPHKLESRLGSPHAFQSTLGYIILGSAPTALVDTTAVSCCCVVSDLPDTLDIIMKRFWELEEVEVSIPRSSADEQCESYYRSSTTRNPQDGRYTVALPFSRDPSTLGDSYEIAKRRFLCLERKLIASPAYKLAYDQVILDYLEKGYISPAPTDKHDNLPSYIIPHHGVVRSDKSSTQLRLVLDASMRTSTNISLNDILHNGENLQGNLFTIIINFRLFAIALSADVRQMFLCIGMCENDRRYQRFLYRFAQSDPIVTYQFDRVCFGIKSSPFHALRTLKRLAEDEAATFPNAKGVLEVGLYMDDVVHSVSSPEEGTSIACELIALLKAGQFDLVKWSSNSPEVLGSIPESHRLSSVKQFDESQTHKVLGLSWSPVTDLFHMQVEMPNELCTKRTILSCAARFWDLMGFLGPVTLYAKILIKELWLCKCDWDDTPPEPIVQRWNKYRTELPLLNQITIPRYVDINNSSVVTIVGFSDASERAYGAAVYLHVNNDGVNSVHLLCSKSRVSPAKVVSLARLELCAALLLAKLIRIVYDTCNNRITIKDIFAFSDSTVALCWIHSSPHRWGTFVANRITKLQSHLSADHFYHVSGADNPADCLSRGLTPGQIADHPLWFRGPPWVSFGPSEWPIVPFDPTGVLRPPESKALTSLVVSEVPIRTVLLELADRFSSWSRLLRCVVYIFRFLRLLPLRMYVSASDLRYAEFRIIKEVQTLYFSNEIKALRTGSLRNPALLKLKPFMVDGILRVGGRLQNSDLSYQQQHPIVLPRKDHIVDLLVDYYHKIYCHAGPDLLMSLLRQNYWIFSARNVIRSSIRKCNSCFRLRPRQSFPEMSNHPACRVTPTAKPFVHVGLDFAGPMKVTPRRGRGVHAIKAYICLFVCLTTRAVHIELASDLSCACFLLAFKRFLSRRGPVSHLYSDNGTNFVGAKSYLNELHKLLVSKRFNSEFAHVVAENRMEWHFNPPAAPHFGGNWESNIKSVKSHLFRVVGAQVLTFEELSTVLAQVEAVLNSRPLCRTLTSDPSEALALTPMHFLTLTPLRYLPAPIIGDKEVDLNQRHSLVTRLVQSFWSRWRNSYLHTLTTRQKWNTVTNPIAIGTVVIIVTDNAPPLHWPLGIIEEVYPAKDGIIRVARVKTSAGSYLRPTVRLCPLPSQ